MPYFLTRCRVLLIPWSIIITGRANHDSATEMLRDVVYMMRPIIWYTPIIYAGNHFYGW